MMRASSMHPEPPSRLHGLLARVDAVVERLDRLVERVAPASLNPLAQTGAIANAAFIVAAVTGVILLPWYSPSVHTAYESVQAMGRAPFTAGLLRSLHRLSSDVTVFFAILHGLRLLVAGRFGGPRKLAWVTGILLVGTLVFVGWLGYWLVWDQRAQSVALGTARMLDGLPIFADPLSRSFLTNENVNSLLFFVVFFLHMLVPLAMGVLLWLHISHLSRSRFLPKKPLAIWLGITLLVAAAIEPASSAGAADLLRPAVSFTIDSFFLVPLWFTDRLSGAGLWAVFAVAGLAAGSLPWWLSRGRAPAAVVDTDRCNGCTLCAQDCPYDAIRMVPRSDGRQWTVQAEVDPSRCVGCGICAGSCDPGGISLPQLPVVDQRKRIEGWIEEALSAGEQPRIAFVCASSAGAGMRIDPESGRCDELPGHRVMAVPCTGWVQRFTLERAVRKGAAGVLVVGCGPVEPHYREGIDWTSQRLGGEREPALRREKVGAGKIRFVTLGSTRAGALRRLAIDATAGGDRADLGCADSPACASGDCADRVAIAGIAGTEGDAGVAHGAGMPVAVERGRAWRPRAGAAAVAAAFGALVALGSDVPYAAPPAGTELVVSFKHPGRVSERCRTIDEEEKAKIPPHMRRDEICDRMRSSVRLAVTVDGEVVFSRAYEPRGLRSDGNSVAVERLPITPGVHRVRVALGDGPERDDWNLVDERTIRVEPNARTVVLYDRVAGFSWYPNGGNGEHTARSEAGE
ncbi:MAG TPA: cytochrome b N-terminal domain-containing protein, partial [Vulgatibacter sp.]